MVQLSPGLLCIGVALAAAGLAAAPAGDTRVADAAMRMDRAGVQTLLKQGVDVNAPQPDGTTALHWAARKDDLETAQLLLRSRAKVDAATRYGVTPLYLASVNGSARMLAALIGAGADPNAANPGGSLEKYTPAALSRFDEGKPVRSRACVSSDPDFGARGWRSGGTVEGNREPLQRPGVEVQSPPSCGPNGGR